MEAVIVILLLSVLAAYVVPKAFSASAITLQAQANTLASDLQRAQNLAVTGGKVVLVCADNTTYLLKQQAQPSDICPSPLPAAQTTEPVFVTLGNGVTFTARPALSYNSMGEPSNSNVTTFTIQASDTTTTYTVSVAALSGLVSVATP